MPKMGFNLNGRVRNFNLTKNQSFMSVLEAVINSIHSIEERSEKYKEHFKGKILIDIKRRETLIEGIKEIKSIAIIDNGIGFTESNMESFLTADSDYKSKIGGKGIGRFTWLKVFQNVWVESIYKDLNEENLINKRTFSFTLNNDDIIDDLNIYNGKYIDNKTTILLENPILDYSKGLCKNTVDIANMIIEHYIEYLLANSNIEIDICDESKIISINQLIINGLIDSKEVDFRINNIPFKIKHLLLRKELQKNSFIYWAANNRVVKKDKLDNYINTIKGATFHNGDAYYVAILSSEYLDLNVSDNRLAFNIPNDDDGLFDNILTLSQIINSTKHSIQDYLQNELIRLQDQNENRVRKYISNTAPEYQYLLKYKKDEIRTFDPTLNDDKLELMLHKLEIEHTNSLISAVKKVKTSRDIDGYEELLEKTIEQLSESNQAKLAKYIAHRKVIIDLFEDGLKIKDEKYEKEAYIHNLIYLMKLTNEENIENYHNLWLIDERLAFCEYIASDESLKKRGDRPDLLFLDNSAAFSDEEGSDYYNTISIIELKRPMRTGYSNEDNPMDQMLKYVRKIRSKEAQTKTGRTILARDTTQFYLYAICDIDKSLEEILESRDYKKTPDDRGYYMYHDKYKAYIEVVPLDKVLYNAKQRNRSFFKKLGL